MTNDALSFTRSFSIALVALLEAVAPPAVSAGILLGLCDLYKAQFRGFFVVLAVLVAALSILLPSARPQGAPQLLSPSWPLAGRILVRWMVIIGILLAVGFVTKYSVDFSRRVVVTWIVATPAILIVVMLCLQELRRRLMYDPAMVRRVAFAGCNEISVALARRIGESGELTGLKVEGFFDDRSAQRLGIPGECARLLGRLPELTAFIKRRGIDVVFVALPVRHIQRVMRLLDELRDTTVSIYYVPDIFAFDLIQARSGELFGIPVVALCETPFCGYRGVIKRITDIAFAASILIVATPLMLALALMVRYSSPGPIIFPQRRYGLDGREITVWKFRSMMVVEDGEQVVQAKRQDPRITAVGRFMRRYSLDELPQLFNVLQGRMSLVGPRPHAVAHNEQYRKLINGYMIRHKVPPGMTGLAQVNGCRGETSRIEEMQARVNYDLEYLRRWTPLLDVKILLLTAVRVLQDEKAY
ncbi:MAG TPA: undecaprenyl-phosphate glucose phosphotransferase [Steroidobacteraceae bacterium]|jgi:putative colanic acid biosynthesis UDP-glucose lipid carrier transferase